MSPEAQGNFQRLSSHYMVYVDKKRQFRRGQQTLSFKVKCQAIQQEGNDLSHNAMVVTHANVKWFCKR